MAYALSIVTPPAAEPVGLDSADGAKAHLRVDHTTDDSYIESLIKAARMSAEEQTGRALITQTLKLTLDEFPAVIRLPRSPVQSVTSITYVDTAGATQTLAASKYQLDSESLVARIVPAYGETWPSTRSQMGAVSVTFVAGYGEASAVPEPIKQAIKLLVGTYYDPVRQTVIVGTIASAIPHAAEYLLGPYRVSTHGGSI